MIETILVAGSKGGTGKSISAAHIIPIFLQGRKIKIFELDSSNTTSYKNSKLISFETMKPKYTDDVLDEIDFNILSNDGSVNIIDTGGGEDTMMVLNSIAKSDLDNLICVIPINDDIDQVDNAKDTILAIKSMQKKVKIFLVLNRISELSEVKIKEQFVGVFGSEKYNIQSRIEEIQNDVSGILFIGNTPLYGILKNHYQTTLLDAYVDAIYLRENINELKKAWHANGRAVFKKKAGEYRFAKDVISLVQELERYTEIFKGIDDEEIK